MIWIVFSRKKTKKERRKNPKKQNQVAYYKLGVSCVELISLVFGQQIDYRYFIEIAYSMSVCLSMFQFL